MKHTLNSLTLILFDLIALTFSLYGAHLSRLMLEGHAFFSGYRGHVEAYLLSGLLIAFYLIINFAQGLYTRRNDFWEELRRSYMGAFLLLLSVVLVLFVTKSGEHYSRTLYLLFFANLLWLAPLGRIAAKKLLHVSGLWAIDAFVTGDERQVAKLKRDLAANPYLGYRSVNSPQSAEVVFIATRGMEVEALETLIRTYKHRVKEVMLIPYLHNISFANAEIVDLRMARLSFINIQNRLYVPKNIMIKKIAELALVALLLPLFLLAFLVIALWIKLDSKGSVLFRQTRLGRDGTPFTCYKFRTMYPHGEALLQPYLKAHPEELAYYARYHKYRHDPRVTRVGRFLRRYSIDELPQMLNVLRRDMSLIGPRPYMLDECSKIGFAAETILHVKPGMTGLWQISGRNDLDFFERVELDVWYIQNWSLWLDFIIFLKTFAVVIKRKGAR
ncbi:MAG: exopolysaccharide biosynthesis polyprenyl glycosylphosphotransferase [Campylobacterales bacterium]|nr:exopolysaccharide biosynthesis polyprenyl glycosylphosphotransferase [Campylobacterales bacterium]